MMVAVRKSRSYTILKSMDCFSQTNLGGRFTYSLVEGFQRSGGVLVKGDKHRQWKYLSVLGGDACLPGVRQCVHAFSRARVCLCGEGAQPMFLRLGDIMCYRPAKPTYSTGEQVWRPLCVSISVMARQQTKGDETAAGCGSLGHFENVGHWRSLDLGLEELVACVARHLSWRIFLCQCCESVRGTPKKRKKSTRDCNIFLAVKNYPRKECSDV